MINGVEGMIKVEQALEAGTDVKEAMGPNADLLGGEASGPKGFPKYTDKTRNLVKPKLTQEMYDRLSKLKTSKGFTLD